MTYLASYHFILTDAWIKDKHTNNQRLFRALHDLINEGITNMEAMTLVKYFMAGLAYQLVDGAPSAYYTHKRFYKPGQMQMRPLYEMKKLDGKSITECIPSAVFCFFLTFVHNCLKELPHGQFEWDTKETKYTSRFVKGSCGGYTQDGINLYWKLLERDINDRNTIKRLPKDHTRADCFWYEEAICNAEENWITRKSKSMIGVPTEVETVKLLFEESDKEEDSEGSEDADGGDE